MMDILKCLGLTCCTVAVVASFVTAPGSAMNDDDPLKKTPPSQSLNVRVASSRPSIPLFRFLAVPRYQTPRFVPGNRELFDILDPSEGRTIQQPPSTPSPSSRTASTTSAVPSTQTLMSISSSWERPESGNTTGVVASHGGSLVDGQRQSPLPLTVMTPEQREEIDQHIRLIQCRIKNCCGPKADQE